MLQKYVASKVFPDRPEVYEPCIRVYNNSQNYDHLFAYEACIRAVLGALETFPHIRILRKVSYSHHLSRKPGDWLGSGQLAGQFYVDPRA